MMRAFIPLLVVGMCGCSTSVIEAGTSTSGSGGATSSTTSSSTGGGGGIGGGPADVAWSMSFGRKADSTDPTVPIPDDQKAAHFQTLYSPTKDLSKVDQTRSLVVDRSGVVTVDKSVTLSALRRTAYPGGGFVEHGAAPAGTSTVRGLELTCAASCNYVVRVDASGHGLWIKSFGVVADGTSVYLVAIPPDGSVRLAGDFRGSLTLGGDTVSGAGDDNTFVASLDSNGDPLWLRSIESASGYNVNFPLNMVADPAGDVALTGNFLGTLELGDGTTVTVTPAQYGGGFVEKLDAAGDVLALKAYGAGDDDSAAYLSAALTDDGAMVIGGEFSGTFDFGGGPVSTGPAGAEVFVGFAPDGSYRWMQTLGPAGQGPPPLSPSAQGHAWLAGQLAAPAMLDGKSFTPIGEADALLVEFDAQGSVVKTRQFGVAGKAYPAGVFAANDGSVFVSGAFDDTIDFGQGPLVAVGALDAFVARIFP